MALPNSIGLTLCSSVLTTLLLASSALAGSNEPSLDWPAFRGDGSGTGRSADIPLTWGEGENLRWAIEIDGLGHSSPIVWKDCVYLTCWTGYGEDPDDVGDPADLQRHLVCIDREHGDVLWTASVDAAEREDPFEGRLASHGYASNTPITDGERIYVHFGKRGVLAFDLEGNELWHAAIGSSSSEWNTGSAGSLALLDNLLFVNAADESFSVRALQKDTGEEVWRRESKALDVAFGAPLVAGSAEQTVVVFALLESIWGLDPKTGNPTWTVTTKTNGSLAPTPIVHENVVYSLGGQSGSRCYAIRLGGSGDVTESHVSWISRHGAYVSSPLHFDGHLYWADERGQAYCLNASSGELIYRERIGGDFYASPVLAGDAIYFVSRTSGTFVLPARPEYQVLAHNTLDTGRTRFDASPAISANQLFLRSETHLYCVQESEAAE
jgi:hypothetical protein